MRARTRVHPAWLVGVVRACEVEVGHVVVFLEALPDLGAECVTRLVFARAVTRPGADAPPPLLPRARSTSALRAHG